jgi:hypothetical protein
MVDMSLIIISLTSNGVTSSANKTLPHPHVHPRPGQPLHRVLLAGTAASTTFAPFLHQNARQLLCKLAKLPVRPLTKKTAQLALPAAFLASVLPLLTARLPQHPALPQAEPLIAPAQQVLIAVKTTSVLQLLSNALRLLQSAIPRI